MNRTVNNIFISNVAGLEMFNLRKHTLHSTRHLIKPSGFIILNAAD